MKKYLETPCGNFPRLENFDNLTDIELIEQCLFREKKTGFVCPEIIQEMKDRGLPELYMTTKQIEQSLIKRKEQDNDWQIFIR